MDKIIKILISMLVLSSCSNKPNYYNNTNNLIIVISNDMTINFEKQKIFIDYYGLKYSDTILFSKIEKTKIVNFYNENNLGSKSGEFWYMDENSLMPAFNDEIIILDKDKIKSKNIINFNYTIDNLQFNNDELKTIKFRNLIFKIVKQKISYTKAYDSLKVFIKRKDMIFI